MTIAAYQTLYESSVAFGMRKALQAEQGKTDMKNQVGKVSKYGTSKPGVGVRIMIGVKVALFCTISIIVG